MDMGIILQVKEVQYEMMENNYLNGNLIERLLER
jgi:hypothetical protein